MKLIATVIRLLVIASLVAGGNGSVAADGGTNPPPHTITIVLVGDSTVTDNAGWGLGFKQFLTDEVELINTARGGRSSMSFIQEGRWTNALALRGDYYLIQFGHNDQPGKPGRSTTPAEYIEYLTRYVDDARKIGAIPVLVTPLVRREFKEQHRIVSSLLPWAQSVRQIAREKNVPLIELHDRSQSWCEQLGKEGVRRISPVKPNGEYDGTHLNAAGYVPVGRLVAEELGRVVPALAPALRAEPRNPRPPAGTSDFDAVVAFDGSGTHPTIQAAIDAAPADTSAARQFRILIQPGVYREHVVIPETSRFLQLMGEPGEETNTIIALGTNVKTPDPQRPGRTLATPDSATVLINGSDVTLRYLTCENTTSQDDRVQALACYVAGDRVAFLNCRFLGWQDTLRADAPRGRRARQYFRDCYIEGHVDYIYAAGTAVFAGCQIHSKADGFITAASTPADVPFGYVFLDCRITSGPGVEKGIYLGRPWRPHAATAFLRCELPAQVRAEGWHNWGNVTNESTARFREFQNRGPGAGSTGRVAWARQLSPAEAGDYTVANILGGPDGWKPPGLRTEQGLAPTQP